MRFVSFGAGLALGCGVLLFVGGDFTPYAGELDRDIRLPPRDPIDQLLKATAVAVPVGTLCGLLFFLTRGWGRDLLRMFCLSALVFTPVVYVYGPFKTVLGTDEVFYEVPWGAVRWAISAACGIALAVTATTLIKPSVATTTAQRSH